MTNELTPQLVVGTWLRHVLQCDESLAAKKAPQPIPDEGFITYDLSLTGAGDSWTTETPVIFDCWAPEITSQRGANDFVAQQLAQRIWNAAIAYGQNTLRDLLDASENAFFVRYVLLEVPPREAASDNTLAHWSVQMTLIWSPL